MRDLDDNTWRWINDNGIVYKPASKATRVVRATGQTGKRALQELGTDGRAALLRLSDDIETERAILRAWENGDLSTEHLTTALRRVEEMSVTERRIYKQMARVSGDDAVEVMAKSDGPARRVMTDGGVDMDFRESIARAADSDATDSFDEIDDAVRKIDDLDGEANVRARELVDETDGAGVKLVNELDDDGLQHVFNLDIDAADAFRTAAARHVDAGYADADEVAEFAKHADNLDGIDGLKSGPVDDFVNAGVSGNIRGALDEVRRADEIGAGNIQRMNLEVYDGKDQVGELDIQVKSGKIVESKGSFGYQKDEIASQFEGKLSAMRSHSDVKLDGNTLEIRANKIGDKSLVKSQIEKWENKIATSSEWSNADVSIQVIDESANTIITR
ncbi:hypothetical protein [Halorhabdus salina]|uniref:hypothetical protein n=1 Tax=Halorhabdus salina TaxID=2750670 RepID=UPI0015EFCDA1|nr:hypothetical protein [Halorhabdus salina]